MSRVGTKIRSAYSNCVHYIPLLKNLVSRNLKKRYRRSILGYLWCMLNPLLVMLIMNFVFSRILGHGIPNYPVYLFSGRMVFSFLTGSTQAMSRSILGNGSLMRKTRVPYQIFPLANFCSEIVDFLFTLCAFALVMIFTKLPLTVHVVAFPLVMLLTFLFSYGLGLFLAQANTFVRDVGYIYGVFTTAWMYLTPLFYALDRVSERTRFVITNFNPAYPFVQMTRQAFLFHEWPSPDILLRGALWAAAMMLLGMITFQRSKDKLILYV